MLVTWSSDRSFVLGGFKANYTRVFKPVPAHTSVFGLHEAITVVQGTGESLLFAGKQCTVAASGPSHGPPCRASPVIKLCDVRRCLLCAVQTH
jgi:hypothetical protein